MAIDAEAKPSQSAPVQDSARRRVCMYIICVNGGRGRGAGGRGISLPPTKCNCDVILQWYASPVISRVVYFSRMFEV